MEDLFGCAYCGEIVPERQFGKHQCGGKQIALEYRVQEEYQAAIEEGIEHGAPVSALEGLRRRLDQLRR